MTFRKLDAPKVLKLKQQGLSNTQIAQRLGVSLGAIYHVLRKIQANENEKTDEPAIAGKSSRTFS